MQQSTVALLKGASRRWGDCARLERSTLFPSLCSFSRAFSSKLFVGGLSYHTTEEILRKAFAEHGNVVDVRIITDRETGRSRGFGFITFNSDSDAEAAKTKMSNHLLDGRFIRVDLASARPPQLPSSPLPTGNVASSSSSAGFAFGTPGMRPPAVEHWGPLPFHDTHATQTSTSQGALEGSADSGGFSVKFARGAETSTLSATLQEASSITSDITTYQSGSSALEVRSNSFDTAAGSNAAHVTGHPTTVFNGGLAQAPIISNTAVTKGMLTNEYSAQNVSASTTSEAGAAPAQTGKTKFENNYSSSSRTGFRSGGGRPPSVLNLGSATYDFSNFPEFDASVFKKLKPPGESEEPKKTVVSHRNKLAPKKAESWQSKLTDEAIPPAQGPLFDFGLGGIPDSPPLPDVEHNLHGGFSLNVNLDELPEAEPVRLPYSIFTARTLPALDLPWLTPEADNWSPIGKPPRRIEDSPYSPFSPDLKDDPEFWWDPYDFDPEAKCLKEAFSEEAKREANAIKETEEGEKHEEPEAFTKVIKEPATEAKMFKESEGDEVPAANMAAS